MHSHGSFLGKSLKPPSSSSWRSENQEIGIGPAEFAETDYHESQCQVLWGESETWIDNGNWLIYPGLLRSNGNNFNLYQKFRARQFSDPNTRPSRPRLSRKELIIHLFELTDLDDICRSTFVDENRGTHFVHGFVVAHVDEKNREIDYMAKVQSSSF